MTPRDNAGRQFSDDVERLLRGEEPLGGSADADYLDTILFARKLVDLGQEPDADFALRLRRRLVTEMAAQDAKAGDTQSWFVKLFSRPGLRLAMVSTFVVLAAIGLVWRAGLLSPMASSPSGDASAGMLSAPPTPLAPETSAPEVARAQTDGNGAAMAMPPASTALTITGHVEPTAAFGKAVSVSFEFSNASPDGYLLTPFPPTIAIREAATGRIVFTSVAGTSGYSLAAMESIQYDFTWDQKDNGGVQVGPGRYQVAVETVEAQSEKGGTSVPAGASDVTAFDILPQAAGGTAGGMDTTQE
jgi:hypothetical protein